jgi:RNA polymerase sigma-70 factor, ECF subfamily
MAGTVRTATVDTTRVACPVHGSRWWMAVRMHLNAQFRRVVPAWNNTSPEHANRYEPELAATPPRASAPFVSDARGATEHEFEDFFTRHQQDIFGYLWRITGEEQAAYDLCQETFLRAWKQFGTISTYERPGAWLLRVATNLAINHQRHHAKSNGRLLELTEYDATESDPALHIVERDAVATALLALPVRHRMALVLRIVYGMPFQEIAQALGVSQVAARTTLSRARQQFRRHYLCVQPNTQHPGEEKMRASENE